MLPKIGASKCLRIDIKYLSRNIHHTITKKVEMSNPFKEDLLRYKRQGKIQWHEPSLWVIAVYRFGQWCINRKQGIVKKVLTVLHLPRGAKIGGGLKIWHFGGIFLNPDTVIGKNCTLRHGVTIGNRHSDHDVPVIGDNVDIGVGAVIMGAIVIGNNVSIGANAVVLCDVPDNHIAVGVPARVIPKI
jgi:serine O-acetyltransferase